MVLPFGVSDGVLSDIIGWKVNIFNLFSKGKDIVVGGIEIIDGGGGVKVREEMDGFIEVGGGFEGN